MKVENTMWIYAVDGKEASIPRPELRVRSVHNRHGIVEIETPDGKRYEVAARELSAAIANATNTGGVL